MTYKSKKGREGTVVIGAAVPITVKENFFLQCREKGDTAANTLRRFIYQYLKENDN